MQKRTDEELRKMPLPANALELEVITEWYFGMPLHLSKLYVYEGGGAQYEVRELYNEYHGDGFLHSSHCTNGYGYSERFWKRVIGVLYCGGIGGHSYGQTKAQGHRNIKRLASLAKYLKVNGACKLRKPFERLARMNGAGENRVMRDSSVQIAGREDGAAAVSIRKPIHIGGSAYED